MNNFKRVNLTQPKQCFAEKCDRCGGSGIYGRFGTCYRCGGNGKDPTHREFGFPVEWSDEQCQNWLDARYAKLEKARQSRQAKKVAAQLAVYNDNATNHPTLAQFYERRSEGGWPYLREQFSESLSPVVQSILSKSFRYPLSDKQAQVLDKALADLEARESRKAAEKAAAKTPEAGRRIVEGVVVSVKETRVDVGYNRSVAQIKILVRCDGYKLFGSAPAAISSDVKAGDSVRLTATVEAKEPGFGFFSRPTGGEILTPCNTPTSCV